jgi:3D (Asp-Asp-Asp) domain-containing protein
MKFTFKEIVGTLIFGALIFGFAFWQGKKECSEKQKLKQELKESKQELKETADKLVKALEAKVTESKPKEVWKTTSMKVTAYCPCKKCCEQWADVPVSSGKRKTASGHTIHVGDKFVAAPRNYPFGTEMVIEGYAGGKVVKVEDVGGAIKDNKLDLYFDSHKTALTWGVRYVDVKVKVSS